MSEAIDTALRDFVVRAGLAPAGAPQAWTSLTGGVSSDIWRVESPGRPVICVKRAVARLRVAADWRAPAERTRYEWRWFDVARSIVPGSAPKVLAHDDALGAFAMAYLEPADHPLWKRELLEGRVDVAAAGAVGERLARLHGGTAGRADIAAAFATDDLFHALRLDPFLLEAARRRPEVAGPLTAIARRTAATRLALAHGDVSPKNILLGPDGPVFLDAETVWYGDPAFDLAFCLNHLLLKHLVVKDRAKALFASFEALAGCYLAGVDWEAADDLEARAASLLPGLMLARVDGKSPADYLPEGPLREAVRAVAIPLLQTPPSRLAEVAVAWSRRPG
ncbi:MAG: phosphotransferase [Proteobacteria bacterium]|nr:phosphotransferase [Pseudomonadota bacterium]